MCGLRGHPWRYRLPTDHSHAFTAPFDINAHDCSTYDLNAVFWSHHAWRWLDDEHTRNTEPEEDEEKKKKQFVPHSYSMYRSINVWQIFTYHIDSRVMASATGNGWMESASSGTMCAFYMCKTFLAVILRCCYSFCSLVCRRVVAAATSCICVLKALFTQNNKWQLHIITEETRASPRERVRERGRRRHFVSITISVSIRGRHGHSCMWDHWT